MWLTFYDLIWHENVFNLMLLNCKLGYNIDNDIALFYNLSNE